MHDEKCNKICRHLVIKLGKRTLVIIQMVIHGWILAHTFDDHVVKDHTNIYHLSHLFSSPSKSRILNNNKSSL
jgi:hypothetical protein